MLAIDPRRLNEFNGELSGEFNDLQLERHLERQYKLEIGPPNKR